MGCTGAMNAFVALLVSFCSGPRTKLLFIAALMHFCDMLGTKCSEQPGSYGTLNTYRLN